MNNAPININDKPRFGFRGLMIDTARHYMPVQFIEHIIDGMAALKLNVMHWHIVDSQSFPYVSELFPGLSGKGAYSPRATYTATELKGLVAYVRNLLPPTSFLANSKILLEPSVRQLARYAGIQHAILSVVAMPTFCACASSLVATLVFLFYADVCIFDWRKSRQRPRRGPSESCQSLTCQGMGIGSKVSPRSWSWTVLARTR